MDQGQRLSELFDRYLRRSLPPAEVEELVSLLGRAEAEDVLSGPMRRVWEELKDRQIEHMVDWDRMLREVSEAEMDLPGHTKRFGRGWPRSELVRLGDTGRQPARWQDIWGWRAVAAVFFTLAGLAAYWSVRWRGPVGESRAATKEISAAVAAAQEGGAGTTAKDKVLSWQTAENKKVIHLADGSMVILNRQSRIDYKAREVVLSGEAYFDIAHRQGQPFRVHTGRIVTRVLGTAFDIRAYSTDKSIEVTVEHGKVQVLKGNANLGLLSDKEQMRVDANADSFRSGKVDLKPVMAWKPEEISFDDVTMEEATRRIGQRFRMNFVFANPALKACRITATFYMEDDLDQIMEVICGVNQSTFAVKGNTVTIDGRGCD